MNLLNPFIPKDTIRDGFYAQEFYICRVNKQASEDYYTDREGRLVFTETYHLKRGYCCGCGCRHCPYGHENVPRKKTLPNGRNPEPTR